MSCLDLFPYQYLPIGSAFKTYFFDGIKSLLRISLIKKQQRYSARPPKQFASEVCEVGSCLLQFCIRQNFLRSLGSSWLSVCYPTTFYTTPSQAHLHTNGAGRIHVAHMGWALGPFLLVMHILLTTCLPHCFWVRPSLSLQILLQRLHQEHMTAHRSVKPVEKFHLGCTVPEKSNLSQKKLGKEE